jgi:hypothetical protein
MQIHRTCQRQPHSERAARDQQAKEGIILLLLSIPMHTELLLEKQLTYTHKKKKTVKTETTTQPRKRKEANRGKKKE